MDKQLLQYQIAITQLPGIGDVLAKNLISYCGGVEAVFKTPVKQLEKIPQIGKIKAHAIHGAEVMKRAEEEIKFIEANNIKTYFFTEKTYPHRLKHCYDSPVLLFQKGNGDLNPQRTISIVGTRRATAYGKQFCEDLVAALAPLNITIISGLAYGIDICAHRAALKNGLPTFAALGHGLHTLYPAQHKNTADELQEYGGLLSDFLSNSRFEKENFPKRNRLIAGLTDATVVIETKRKGGSRITAEIANSYDRDVFAVPGNAGSQYSVGCNELIKTHKAALMDSPDDLIKAMNWDIDSKRKTAPQKQLFAELSSGEQKLVDVIRDAGNIRIDELASRSQLPGSAVATNLLNLELKGLVRTLPGKQYELT